MGARRASRVLFPSRAASELIRVHLPIPEEKVRIVHYGIDLDIFTDDTSVEAPRPYLFLPAALEKHKNIELLIRGLPMVGDSELELWLAGRSLLDARHRDALFEICEEHGVTDRVKALGPVPYRSLLGYYRGALALAMPSFLETFGHPVLEAMAAGTPLLLSDIPVFRELAEDTALFFDPRSPEDFAGCVDALVSDEAGRSARVAGALARVEDFSWKQSVDSLCRVLDEVASERRR